MVKRIQNEKPEITEFSKIHFEVGEKTKENIVVKLFIVGFIFIIISTFYFIYQIPNLEMETSSSEEVLRISDYNYLLFSLYQSNEDSIRNQIKTLSDLDPNSTKIKSLQDDLVLTERISLAYMYTSVTGKVVDSNLVNEWNNMNISQLEAEKNKISEISPSIAEKMADSLTKLRKNKKDLHFYASFLQILGLSFNQIALLLQIKWIKGSKGTILKSSDYPLFREEET